MQVKKFEAKTMKEALEMVKVHLGPEAIILSAKDTQRGFGLMGDKSVEVTAAVSDETLRKKKLAEAKLRDDLRERFHQIPASRQKQFINKAFEAREKRQTELVAAANHAAPLPSEVKTQLKGMRYIDIEDEDLAAIRESREQASISTGLPKKSTRVSAAAAAAAHAAKATFSAPPAQAVVASARASDVVTAVSKSSEVIALETQVKELRALVERFQTIPQISMSMHPGAEQGLPFELSGTYQRLTGQGLQPQLVTSMLRKAQKELDMETLRKPALVDAWAVKHLLNTIDVSANSFEGRYHVFMGSTGQGKSTTLIKFASRLMLKEKRTIAIISLDTFKLGATDQMRLYAQILNVPFAIVRTPEEWAIAEQKLARVQHVFVDCPGLSLRNQDEIEWLRRMLPPMGKTVHFVQSILGRDEETSEIAARYQAIGFNDVIFTRVDESSRRGVIVNFQDRFKVPLHSFGTGSRIPEDYELATKERVVDLIFKL